MTFGITVCIPSLPDRFAMRLRAFASASAQNLMPHEIHVMIDHFYDGEIAMRNALLESVTTEWIAWLDDDDEMRVQHLEILAEASEGVDLVYSNYQTYGADYVANFIEPAYMVRTKVLRDIGGYPPPEGDDWPYRFGDWGLLAKLMVKGYKFRHVDRITWNKYMHDGQITGAGFNVADLAGH